MIIQSQNIAMGSRRRYQQSAGMMTKTSGAGQSMGTFFGKAFDLPVQPGKNTAFAGSLYSSYLNTAQGMKTGEMAQNAKTDKTEDSKGITNSGEDMREAAMRIQFETLNYLLRIFFVRSRGAMNQGYSNVLGNYGLGSMQLVTEEQLYYYQETEETSFSAQGTVVTADGRELDFQMDVGMSRSFYEGVYQQSLGLAPMMCDPLVINLDTDVAAVSDQKFYFDLDCDGKEDEISTLEAGSGFLALDLNEDGVINDGSELFGTSSGDGFYDLSKYDLDGNGWIDEADEVFDKLKIWVPSADGKGACYKLKEKGVGAICLQNVSTDFDLKNDEGQQNGRIRKTGMFFMESGAAGTIQHVDLAM